MVNEVSIMHENIKGELQRKVSFDGQAPSSGQKSFLGHSAANAPSSSKLSHREIGKSVQASEKYKGKSSKTVRIRLCNTGRKHEKNYVEGLKELRDLI